MNIKPLGDRVLLKVAREEEETTTKSGIILTNKEPSQRPTMDGEVLAIGKEVEDIEVGDVIRFEKYSATIMDVDDDFTYVLSDPKHLYAIIV